jgi:ElaB/YqjD/DUF883 family membrane-anchored ribosome-binding protein
MTTSAQLEREAEATRAHIADTLDELRNRVSPGQVVDQLVDYAREGSGATFVRNLRNQIVDNPLPLTLVSAGLAWLIVASRRTGAGNGISSGRSFGRVAADRTASARESVGEMSDSASAAARDFSDTASETAAGWAESARSTASDFAERARGTTSRLQDQAGAAAASVSHSASGMRASAGAASRSIADFFQEQPLVLAGIGLALGAAIGAALPSTRTEDELMGETSDALKEGAASTAEEQLDKGKAVASKAWEGAKEEAEKQTGDGEAAPAAAEHHEADEFVTAAPLAPSDGGGAPEHPEFGPRNLVHGRD